VIVVSVACSIGVLVSILALSAGLRRAYVSGGSDAIAIVLSRDAEFEWRSSLSRSDVQAVMNAQGIAYGSIGGVRTVLASPEFRAQLPPVPGAADGSIQVRGVNPAGVSPELRPQFRIVSGRMFRPGVQELIIGAGIVRVHGNGMGGSIIMPDGEWPIVGTFTDGGSIAESDLLGDADTLMASLKLSTYSSVLLAMAEPAAFNRIADHLQQDPGLKVSVERQSAYLMRAGIQQSQYFRTLAFTIGAMMAVGALFACLKILYASVGSRSREMATLRAMGYARTAVAASVVAEGLLLAVLGALIGSAVAWLLLDGRHVADYDSAFSLAVTPEIVLLGLAWAVVLTLLGSIMPAMRAARLTVVDALRGE
jgi:putative ABC transport system permease protein